jgi:hypothetical protein
MWRNGLGSWLVVVDVVEELGLHFRTQGHFLGPQETLALLHHLGPNEQRLHEALGDLPPVEDEALLPLLEQQGIPFEGRRTGWFAQALVWLLPRASRGARWTAGSSNATNTAKIAI